MFRAKDQIITNALRAVDDRVRKNNKIVFADDADKVESKNVTNGKQMLLFGDDETDEEMNETLKFMIDGGRTNEKLSKLQVSIGSDRRFALDHRFVDEKNVSKEHSSAEMDPQEEKKWQLDILQTVLGKSINMVNESDDPESRRRKKMIRYDPTESNHQKYEVAMERVLREAS